MAIKNVFMIFCTPKNGGDLGIIESVIYIFENYLQSSKLTIAHFGLLPDPTKYSNTNVSFIPELDSEIFSSKNQVISYIKYGLEEAGLIKFVYKLYATFFSRHSQYLNYLENSKLVISSPGGYIHPYYGNADKYFVFKRLMEKQSKYILLAQSISSTTNWKKKTNSRFIKNIIDNAFAISARESTTFETLPKSANNILSSDIAFILNEKIKIKTNTSKTGQIAVNFRTWGDLQHTKYSKLLDILIEKYNLDIHFISSCQGFSDYTDDSKNAEEIKRKMSNGNKVKIHTAFYHPLELVEILKLYDCTLGMRLHTSIYSMLAGVPSINISYEDKGKALFNDLGIGQLSVSLDEKIESIIQTFHHLYENYEESILRNTKAVELGYQLSLKNVVLLKRIL